jgi:hypothetical protein
MSEPTTQTARKRHRCDWCWQHIEPKDVYLRYRCFDAEADIEAATVKMHPECFSAMQQEAGLEGGWIEWEPGRRGQQ